MKKDLLMLSNEAKERLDQLQYERDKSKDKILHTDAIRDLIVEFIDLDYERRKEMNLVNMEERKAILKEDEEEEE